MTTRKKSDSKQKPESKTVASSRRKLLKTSATAATVLAATELPKYWKSPVVNSVILPSHANTTDGGGTDLSGVVYFGRIPSLLRNLGLQDTVNSSVVAGTDENLKSGKLVTSIRDLLIPEAEAQNIVLPPVPVEQDTLLCITPNGDNYDVILSEQFGFTIIHRTTTVELDSFRLLGGSPSCANTVFMPLSIKVSNPTASSIDYEFQTQAKQIMIPSGSIPAAACAIPAEVCPPSGE